MAGAGRSSHSSSGSNRGKSLFEAIRRPSTNIAPLGNGAVTSGASSTSTKVSRASICSVAIASLNSNTLASGMPSSLAFASSSAQVLSAKSRPIAGNKSGDLNRTIMLLNEGSANSSGSPIHSSMACQLRLVSTQRRTVPSLQGTKGYIVPTFGRPRGMVASGRPEVALPDKPKPGSSAWLAPSRIEKSITSPSPEVLVA